MPRASSTHVFRSTTWWRKRKMEKRKKEEEISATLAERKIRYRMFPSLSESLEAVERGSKIVQKSDRS